MSHLLEIRNLSVRIKDRAHGDFYGVRDLSLNIAEGKALGIVGESGSGKSVTALAVMGLSSKDSRVEGDGIYFENRDLSQLKEPEMRSVRGKEIAMIFQDPMSSLNPLMKIGKQVEENLLLHSRLEKCEIRERALEIMGFTGLKEVEKLYHAYPHQLSGGMRQRVLIASAIIAKPKLLIADEPTTALDSTTQTQILTLFQRLKEENRMSLLFISHNFGVIHHISDYIAVMYNGYLMEYGNNKDITQRPLHPYTKALIQCIPSADKKGLPLFSIKNSLNLNTAENACPFAGRCDYTAEKCLDRLPENFVDNRFVRCARIGEI